MSNNFKSRYYDAQAAEHAFTKALSGKPEITVKPTGVESRFNQDEIEALREASKTDRQAYLTRYYPDYEVDFKKSEEETTTLCCEIKNAYKSIERNCFEAMIELEKNGKNIRILFLDKETGEFRSVKPSEVVFHDGTYYNAFNIPIEDKVWRNPRKFTETWTEQRYNWWKQNYRGSGTACALIDWHKTPFKKLKLVD